MAIKPKTSKLNQTPGPGKGLQTEQNQVNGDKAEASELAARLMTDGSCNAVVVQTYLGGTNAAVELPSLVDQGAKQAKAAGTGDLSQLESMLLTQATALQAMFVDLAVRGRKADHRHWKHEYTTLALKCAAQSRQAIVALAELRQPKSVMFARQANLASGPQQVINGNLPATHPSRAEQISAAPNELLEAGHVERLDRGATAAASGVDPQMEAVGTVNRPPHDDR